ncbi:hypothetical protein ACIRON_10185 [Nocardioides sp. NPDC101246]|uniref:hypothetical protein n=1 Tax=Nocardioides sp. NPDC101246 TaxID=3364336 RepID=UPI0037F2F277
MSLDLMVFANDGPASIADAERLLDLEADGEEWHEPPEDEVDPRVRAFLRDIFASYPPLESLSDDELGSSVWSVTPGPDTRLSTYLCMSFASPPGVVNLIARLARRHGLVLYDPQTEEIHNPH